MAFLNTYFGLTNDYLLVLGVNLIITILVLLTIKFIIGKVSNVDVKEELSVKDNPAMGISLGGIILAVGIIMTGVIGGEESATTLQKEIITVALSGLVGIILIFLARVVFDKLSMKNFNVRNAIMEGNTAVAIMDAGNVIATALIIKAVLAGTDIASLNMILIGLGSFIVSQLLLTLSSHYRIILFKKHHGTGLEDEVMEGNIALALRFSGFKIGMGFAIVGALTLAPLNPDMLIGSLSIWLGVGLVQMILVVIFSLICEKVLLSGVDTRDEVDGQSNIAVGAVQAVLYVVIGLIIFTLVS